MNHDSRSGNVATHSGPSFRAVCDASSLAKIVVDGHCRCIYMNTAAEALCAASCDDIMDRPQGNLFARLALGHEADGRDTIVRDDGMSLPVEYTVRHMPADENMDAGTLVEFRDASTGLGVIRSLEEETRTLEIINRTGSMLAAKLDLEDLVQAVTDAATQLSGAQFGAFFYNTVREGESLLLYTLSGAPRAAFDSFPQPRHTQIFKPSFAEGEVLRIADVSADPRYANNGPFHGMPPGHLPVASFLSVPVISRTGTILGALLFGHEKPDVFTDRSERITTAIAAQAAVAIDNSHLFAAAQKEVEERQRAEEHQTLLVQELNHRVKNMLSTVSSIASHTLRGYAADSAMEAFQHRLMAYSQSHSLIMRTHWREVKLIDLARTALQPFADLGDAGRVGMAGPEVRLSPRAALALGMGFHELATNAVKYGALGSGGGHLGLRWEIRGEGDLVVKWTERGGPTVAPPRKKGFGSRLLERGLAHELGGTVDMRYDPEGASCEICLPFDKVAA